MSPPPSDPRHARDARPARDVQDADTAENARTGRTSHDAAARALLPLKPDILLILTVLARGPRHGYAILQESEAASGGEIRLQPGALYRRLGWMLDHGLIDELDDEPAGVEGHDDRRRYYRVTAFGTAVARAEADRMGRAVAAARDAGLVGGHGP